LTQAKRSTLNTINELITRGLDGVRWYHWWPLLLGPCLIVFLHLCKAWGWRWILKKGLHERAAIVILSASVGIYLLRALFARTPPKILLAYACTWAIAVIPAAATWTYAHDSLRLTGAAASPSIVIGGAVFALAMVFVARELFTRMPVFNPDWVLLSLFVLTALCRELHFPGTSKGVWVSLVVLVMAAWAWRERLVEPLSRGMRKPALIQMFSTYLLGVLIARHAFKFLPLDPKLINLGLEESLENLAHFMLLACAFADLWPRHTPRDSGAAHPQ
jgi:hypothetical protein